MSNRTAFQRARFNSDHDIAPRSRILVVDDDEPIRKLHAAMLEFEGYEVELASNGAEALERLAAGKFDLVLTDRQMPVLDGERMVLALRSAGLGVPVVMVSGSLDVTPLCASVASELTAALPKPIRIAEALTAVASALVSSQPRFRVAA